MQSPNVIRFHSKKPNEVQKEVLYLSPSVTGTWLYSLVISIVENLQAPYNASSDSSVRKCGKVFFLVFELVVVHAHAETGIFLLHQDTGGGVWAADFPNYLGLKELI